MRLLERAVKEGLEGSGACADTCWGVWQGLAKESAGGGWRLGEAEADGGERWGSNW